VKGTVKVQTKLPVSAFALSLALSGCCAPDACYVAQSRFAELDPLVEQLLLFKEVRGYFPATLEDAFPNGLPSGVSWKDGNAGDYAFRLERGGFAWFSYDSLDKLGLVSKAQAQDGSTDGQYGLWFSYVGGGIIAGMNDCRWTTIDIEWRCSGYL
jgi:hypothetical protein